MRRIEWAARFSHATEDAQTADSWERFVKAVVIDHGDWSVVEHATVSVDFLVDRGVTHELVRHRLFSFTQSSTRFINYAKKMLPGFVKPLFEPAQRPDDIFSLNEKLEMANTTWDTVIDMCEAAYRKLIDLGLAPQIARSVFPNALSSRILITGNLRNWRHFLIMRTTKETHPQCRQVTLPLLAEFQEKIPILFDDIVPMDRQANAIKKAR